MGNGEWGMGKAGYSEFGIRPMEAADTREPGFALPIPDSPFPIPVLNGHSHTAMIAADAILLASGTAALEAMLAKRPMVVGYKVAPWTYRIVKAFGMLKVERYALPNVLAGEDLAPELMQDDCTPEKLAAALLHWFQHPEAVAALQPKYLQLHHALRQDASARAADAVAELLVEPGSGRHEG